MIINHEVCFVILEFSNDRKEMAKVFVSASELFHRHGPIGYQAMMEILKK